MSDNLLIWRIKTILKQQGISQRELSAMLGKKETEISRWLSGRVGISEHNLQRIEQALGTNLKMNNLLPISKLPIRVGVVGTGNIANRFASEILYVTGIEINAAYDVNMDQLRSFCDKYHIPIKALSFEQMLLNCDAVYIASPISTHYYYVKVAVENNKHVLCEMPFTGTKSEAIELFKMADRRGITLIPALKTAFCPSFLKLIEIAKSGEIGDIADISGTVTTMLPDATNSEFNNERLLENATYPILATFKLWGTNFRKVHAYTQFVKESEKALFSHTILNYSDKVASLKVGTGVKSEGSLVISGTKGYIYATAPWWKTDYFEVRFENMNFNRKLYFPYEQAGLRYEIQAFVNSIYGKKNTDGLTRDETIKMIEIQNKIIYKNDTRQ